MHGTTWRLVSFPVLERAPGAMPTTASPSTGNGMLETMPQIGLFLFNRDTGPVANIFRSARDCVEKCRLSGIRVPSQCDFHT
jgi:hypothetical protein